MKNNIAFTLLATLIIGIFGATMAAVSSVKTAPIAYAKSDKVTICHATESESNPYVRIVVSENAIQGHFENNGTPLAGHEDDILFEGDVACPGDEEDILQTLTLTSICTLDNSHKFRVRNPNDVNIDFTWEVVGTGEKGTGTANANTDTFFEVTAGQPGTTKIKYTINDQQTETVKAQNNTPCEKPQENQLPLSLTSICTLGQEHKFRVRNTNTVNIPFTWELYPNITTGSGTATASADTFFMVPAAQPGTTKIYYTINNASTSATKAQNNIACETPEEPKETPSPSPSPTVTPTPTSGPTATPTPGSSNNPTATPTPGTGEVLSATDTKTPKKGVLGASTLAGTGTFNKTAADGFMMLALAFFTLSGAAYVKKNR